MEMMDVAGSNLRRVKTLVINFDDTYKLETITKFLCETSNRAGTKLKFEPLHLRALQFTNKDWFCDELMQNHRSSEKLYDIAILVLSANESRLNINEEGSGVGLYTLYQTLRKVTDDKVLVIIGDDQHCGEKCKDPISAEVKYKISGQFTNEYIYGPKGLIFSWHEHHGIQHIESLLQYCDVTPTSPDADSELIEAESQDEDTLKTDQPSNFRRFSGHKPLLAMLIVAMCVFYVATMVFNFLGSSELGRGLYENSTGDVSNIYYIEITPAGWTFSISWRFIYIWQGIWLVYVLVSLFRKGLKNQPLYTDPELITIPFCWLILLNWCCNITWILVWDRQFIGWSLIPIALVPFALYLCLGISFYKLNKHGDLMLQDGYNKDIWMTRLFVQNGMAFYATWTTIATLLNFAVMLTYRANLAQDIASTISLGILTFEIIIWFLLESTVLDRWVRYIFSPYIVMFLALSGSIARNWNPTRRNSIMTAALLGIAVLLALMKIILVIWRHRRRPVFGQSHHVSLEVHKRLKIN